MDTRVGHQVGLKLGQIDVEGAIEAERSRDWRHNLADETVQVGVRRALNVQVTSEKNNDNKLHPKRSNEFILEKAHSYRQTS